MKARDERARQRLQAILEQMAGRITAEQAAGMLGVSRKTFYEWKQKALDGMEEALLDGEPGRPAKPVDPEKEELQKREVNLTREVDLLRCRLQVLDELIREPPRPAAPGWKKKE
jgi:transposase